MKTAAADKGTDECESGAHKPGYVVLGGRPQRDGSPVRDGALTGPLLAPNAL